MFRYIEDYEGVPIHFNYGQVSRVIYEDEYTYLQLYVSNTDSEWEGDVAARYYGDQRLLEDDYIELWAVAEGLHEYETVNGNIRTIPLLTIVEYELYDSSPI
ncbi:hypothetical protein AUR66_00540 [Haloferax profundi]|uniref:Uncharacterized protein n=2 Tax=Haloferax profundi TaxID=1544718 RepID=A0A0W1SW19_9EURY|nr:hypothetical protein AUR66_00540 [Haloferax profundi]